MSTTRITVGGRTELRQRLDEISGRSPEDIALHRERVEALSGACPHSIKYIEDGGGDRSDCIAYALEIPIKLLVIAATLDSILDKFVRLALPRLLEQMPDSEASHGLVVLYFKDGETKHVGRIQGTRVSSKWGKNPVYEHDISEIPASYGDEYEVLKPPSVRYITNKFIDFVRRHPRYVDIRNIFEESVIECGYESRLLKLKE